MGLFDKIKELANSANDKYKQKIEETSANLINKSNQAAKKVTPDKVSDTVKQMHDQYLNN